MIPLDPNLRTAQAGTVVALPAGGKDGIAGDLLKALLQAGKIEARVLQILNQSALIDFLDLGAAKVRTEVPLRAGDVFTAVVEAPAEGSSEPVRLRIAQIRHEPAAPLKPERLAEKLEEMNFPPDPKHQAMARALLRHAGTVSREAMTQLGDALNRLSGRPGAVPEGVKPEGGEPVSSRAAMPSGVTIAASAKLPVPVKILEAAALLVAKGLPVSEESVAWVSSRLSAASTPGARLGEVAKQLLESAPAAGQALMELALPEGEAAETADHLVKLMRAFTPPEARIAKELALLDAVKPPPAGALAQGEAQQDEPQGSVPKGDRAEAPPRQPPPTTPDPSRPSVANRPLAEPLAEPLARIQEAVTAVLTRALRGGEGGEPIREALSEVRFGQLMNASAADPHHPTADRSLAVPLWWSGGSGEIRVQYQAQEGKKRQAGEPEETRVVVTLDTTHLQRVKVDLLLGRKQLNCQVAVQEEAVAELLAQHLPELRAALESSGLRVNVLGVKRIVPKAATAVDSLRQVDVWL